jgi:hypothetical protein
MVRGALLTHTLPVALPLAKIPTSGLFNTSNPNGGKIFVGKTSGGLRFSRSRPK